MTLKYSLIWFRSVIQSVESLVTIFNPSVYFSFEKNYVVFLIKFTSLKSCSVKQMMFGMSAIRPLSSNSQGHANANIKILPLHWPSFYPSLSPTLVCHPSVLLVGSSLMPGSQRSQASLPAFLAFQPWEDHGIRHLSSYQCQVSAQVREDPSEFVWPTQTAFLWLSDPGKTTLFGAPMDSPVINGNLPGGFSPHLFPPWGPT